MGQSGMFIAIDPGASPKENGTTGYARFGPDGSSISMEYFSESEIRHEFMSDIWDAPSAVICEDWRLDPKVFRAYSWSRMPTCKLIGWLEGVCYMQNILFILQGAQIKKSGYQHWGKKPLPKSNPMNHAYDAFVHGREYLIKEGIIRP